MAVKNANLVSIPTLVESPFIIVTIAGHTFGMAYKSGEGLALTIEFPNFMQSLTVVKVNGEVNTYNLRMVYQIKEGDDPNLLDNVFSQISDSRTMTISYGDWCSPGNIYKEEEVLVTNVKSTFDFSGSRINYDIAGVSKGLNLMSDLHNFPAQIAKPSTVILGIINNPDLGIQKNFSGMANMQKVLMKQLIASDDQAVKIEAKNNISTYDYLVYLVSCMIPESQQSTLISSQKVAAPILAAAYYALSIIDDNKNDMGGSYFKVTKIGDSESTPDDKDSYVLDIGYPGNNFITSFSISENETWAILFDSSNTSQQNKFTYTYDINGALIQSDSPSVTRSKDLLKTTAADKAWWTKMTEFPIKAVIDFKGLVRPTLLVSYVKIDVRFYGRKQICSGTYIITKQTDNISQQGYKTTLELQRIKGDPDVPITKGGGARR